MMLLSILFGKALNLGASTHNIISNCFLELAEDFISSLLKRNYLTFLFYVRRMITYEKGGNVKLLFGMLISTLKLLFFSMLFKVKNVLA